MERPPWPELRDVELKLGRRVPESLARCLRGEGEAPTPPPRLDSDGEEHRGGPCSALRSLESKVRLLRRGMTDLRATDVKLMRQLLIINESIESIKWMIEEKGAMASRGSSLSGSLCSLLESQETSRRGSYNSLQDCSDGLDSISVGSYLDTLADDVPDLQTPPDMDRFSDSSLIDGSQILHKHTNFESDEYYCFG